ncbi:hypothetical protein IFO69_13775 [Echinicola sp. CAU 1574]|uniref:Uncharacterized protein n=1 Tax=Echinicola arenosa TaxID=2774144 RepID=A0ABR9AM05_9BACT|nr:hypothetical protein [Echinicola arenosa]MBD8489822.1 hypothetical protein [Echinicola arenosa]
MIRKILLVFFLLGVSVTVYGQGVCGTPHDLNSEIFHSSDQQESLNQSIVEAFGSTDGGVCINVYFHIVRNNSGSGGITVNELDGIIDDLSQFYNSHNIYFNNYGHDFIDNTNFQTIDDATEAATLAQVNNQSDAINYYIV